jgi:hypothetical protein
MKETLYKFESRLYRNIFYKDHSELSENDSQKKLINDYNTIFPSTKTEICFSDGKKAKDPIFFTLSHSTDTELDFEKNFGNPLCAVSKRTLILVVEKDGDKVTIKKFNNSIFRKVGKSYFQKSSRVDYISYNIHTKFIYTGFITNYHKKNKAIKSVRKNYFPKNILNNFLLELKSTLNSFEKNNNSTVISDATNCFTKNCVLENDLVSSWDDLFYKKYLEKMGIKYPNNYSAYRTTEYSTQPKLKEIKKSNMRLVDAFMKKNNLTGKVLKKALHEVDSININIHKHAIKNFGLDLINNDYELTKSCLEYPSDYSFYHDNDSIIYDNFNGSELKNVFEVFRNAIIYKKINLNSFWDHVRYYIKLKKYGEPLRWKIRTTEQEFQREHLEWSDKIASYEQGTYERIYPEHFEKICGQPIESNGFFYKPVLLKKSSEYNEESSVQSNCVRNYIGYSNSIIFSIRNGGIESQDRATIEYRLEKNSEDNTIIAKNVQSRIRYNQTPNEEWKEVIDKLDYIVNTFVNGKFYKNVEIKKTCKNGVILQTGSDWKNGYLSWIKEDLT